MTEEDRTQWIVAASASIRDANISPNDLARAAAKARLDPTCDHPAKVVPAIVRALGESWSPYTVWDWTPEQVAAQNAETAKRAEAARQFDRDMRRLERCEMTQDEINALPLRFKQLADCLMLLRKQDDGIYRYWKYQLNRESAA